MLYALHAERGATLVWNGRLDDVAKIPAAPEKFFGDLQARVTALRGRRDGIFEFGLTDGGSHRPYFLTKPVAIWLERQLDFPNWTEAQVRALPETHISEWSKKTGVPIDNLYATEDREGGAMAIGEGVHGIEREQLSVFTPAEWEKEKRALMFDTWAERARAAEKK